MRFLLVGGVVGCFNGLTVALLFAATFRDVNRDGLRRAWDGAFKLTSVPQTQLELDAANLFKTGIF